MPICSSVPTTRISQDEFKQIAAEVVHHVFAIHNEFGRFFNEGIYKKELASRMSGVVCEIAITESHGTFLKQYSADVLVNDCALFEFKAADALHPRHRGQTLNYLLLLDLAHGKVINVRPSLVEHDFVNCPSRLANLREPTIVDRNWNSRALGGEEFRHHVMSLVSDWGSGLESQLYEEALIHFLGGEETVVNSVPVMSRNEHLGYQRMRLVSPNTAFKITALQDRLDDFEKQARKLVHHTTLTAIHWANLTQKSVTFTTIQ